MRPLGARPLLSEWGWQTAAACRGMASSVFFSPPDERGTKRRRREERARLICGTCPVRRPCAAFAVRTAQTHGVWGGLTEADRAAGQPTGRQVGPLPRHFADRTATALDEEHP